MLGRLFAARSFSASLCRSSIRAPLVPFSRSISVQAKAPSFSAQALVDNNIAKISIDDYKDKWILLFFYPLDFTFVCPTEITAFADNISKFNDINTQVIGVSVDSVHAHLAWSNIPRNQGGIGSVPYPLVSDITKSISSSYGVLFTDGPNSGLAARGTFIIDPKGIVRQISINDLSVGRSIEETLRLIEAFQLADSVGHVCPANWKRGSSTIIADPTESKKFFQENN